MGFGASCISLGLIRFAHFPGPSLCQCVRSPAGERVPGPLQLPAPGTALPGADCPIQPGAQTLREAGLTVGRGTKSLPLVRSICCLTPACWCWAPCRDTWGRTPCVSGPCGAISLAEASCTKKYLNQNHVKYCDKKNRLL